ncbi:hypothetical protein BGZ59_001518, partial [Podila verticillata]
MKKVSDIPSPSSTPTAESVTPTIFEMSLPDKEADLDCDEKDRAALEAKTPTPLEYPEGGFGWLVVFGAFMIQFCGFGFNFSWGVYQEYYLAENIFPGATLSQVSWVGGIGASSVFLTGPFQASMTRRFGLRPMIAAGAVISSTGIILASFTKELWQLYLTQWFNKRRGLASGISVAGSGIGGAALAPLNRFLISKVGFRWALRVMGLSFVVIIFSVLVCIRTRIPIGRRGGPIFDFSLFREPGFVTMYFM